MARSGVLMFLLLLAVLLAVSSGAKCVSGMTGFQDPKRDFFHSETPAECPHECMIQKLIVPSLSVANLTYTQSCNVNGDHCSTTIGWMKAKGDSSMFNWTAYPKNGSKGGDSSCCTCDGKDGQVVVACMDKDFDMLEDHMSDEFLKGCSTPCDGPKCTGESSAMVSGAQACPVHALLALGTLFLAIVPLNST
eukprot:gb/GFBE01065627.1/.p1 GENE.gb/GFBE01065627.1/~~gb/GFBE01065627.1/.p1  ORF type:complete len:192 (+),score=28.05 gb/GFBE01065627.1/:1-576(+)